MKVSTIRDILYAEVPRKVEWSKGEAYGFRNIGNKDFDVNRILYCVTPTDEIVQYATANGYDLLISHHPFTVNGMPHAIFHTALDCCKGGLNDQWREMLGIKNSEHFDGTLGEYGDIEPIAMKDLIAKIEQFVGHRIIGSTYNEKNIIKSVVVCTGLGGMVTDLARTTEADCYIIGEAIEPVDEMGFSAVIEVGHTLSERMGVNLFRTLLPELAIDLCPLELDVFGREFHPTKKEKAS